MLQEGQLAFSDACIVYNHALTQMADYVVRLQSPNNHNVTWVDKL